MSTANSVQSAAVYSPALPASAMPLSTDDSLQASPTDAQITPSTRSTRVAPVRRFVPWRRRVWVAFKTAVKLLIAIEAAFLLRELVDTARGKPPRRHRRWRTNRSSDFEDSPSAGTEELGQAAETLLGYLDGSVPERVLLQVPRKHLRTALEAVDDSMLKEVGVEDIAGYSAAIKDMLAELEREHEEELAATLQRSLDKDVKRKAAGVYSRIAEESQSRSEEPGAKDGPADGGGVDVDNRPAEAAGEITEQLVAAGPGALSITADESGSQAHPAGSAAHDSD